MKILFPSQPFEPKKVDYDMSAEWEAAKLAGFELYLYDHDAFVGKGEFKTNLAIRDFETLQHEDVIVRGWMFTEKQYTNFYDNLGEIGYLPITSPSQYVQCHHFPEVYQYINEFTSKTWWSGEWSLREDKDKPEEISWAPVRDLLGGDILIKDYVKSENGNPDLFILSKDLSNEEFGNKVQKFIEARGKLFNKGLVFKSVEKLKQYEGQTNEWRLFFFDKKLITFTMNTKKLIDKAATISVTELDKFATLAQSIPSNFFTMDIAEKEDGTWMILECGDGQVSGLAAHEEPIKFYNKLNNILNGVIE